MANFTPMVVMIKCSNYWYEYQSKVLQTPQSKRLLDLSPVKISWKTVQNVTRLQDVELKISAQIQSQREIESAKSYNIYQTPISISRI